MRAGARNVWLFLAMASIGIVAILVAEVGDTDGLLLKAIPEKLVVLTFDNSCISYATFVAPLLKKYGFVGTFYITEAFKAKGKYMTWEHCHFTFHGVTDLEHPGVGLNPACFEECMQYLKDNQYTVIAMRDMAKYVDVAKAAKPFVRQEAK
jgi:hypothetical protein